MTASHSEPKPPNTQVELAKGRNRIAADRTLLSWIRLSLTLIGIGFGIDQAVNLIYQEFGNVINPLRFSHVVGLLFVGVGLFAILMAILDYRGELARLDQADYVFTPRWALGKVVAIALLAIALLSFGTIFARLLATR